jgi:hypothetical protein
MINYKSWWIERREKREEKKNRNSPLGGVRKGNKERKKIK